MFSFALHPAQRLGPSSFFLTSAHCFSNHIPREPVRIAFQGQFYRCSKQHFFNSSSMFKRMDLALVRCAGVPAPPTSISALHYRLHQPAALLGFSSGKCPTAKAFQLG